MNRLQIFIGYLRTLDDGVRKVWVYILSGISMAFIVTLWVLYINITIEKAPSALVQQIRPEVKVEETKPETINPLIANFKRNSSQILENLKSKIFGLTNKGNDIIITK
ncbi:MAG: hypothetical protein Q8L47_03665 [bacterium]|nr:hypothetical protein [bacterium]